MIKLCKISIFEVFGLKRYIAVFMAVLILFTLGITVAFASEEEVEDSAEISSEETFSPEIQKTYTEEPSCTGKVKEILSVESEEKDFADGFVPVKRVYMMVEVTSGARKGQVLPVMQEIQPNDEVGLNDIRECKVGDKITLYFSVDEYGNLQTGTMIDFIRINTIAVVAICFGIFLLLFCGFKGVKSFGALLLTCFIVLFIMIPMIYDGGVYMLTFSGIQKIHILSHGVNPVLASVVTSVFIIGFTLTIVYGWTNKTLAALLGAGGGTVIAGILSSVMIEAMKITGVMDEQSKSLVFTTNGAQLDISGILFAAVLIGALGGTIDVGISIASALDELAEKAKHITSKELMKSGMNIGRDILGASLNTLILAYVGGSIQILILFYAYDMPLIDIVNTEQISAELLRALAGSFGLLCTVPITSFVCATMMVKGGWKKEDFKIDFPALVEKLKFWEKKSVKAPKKKWKILSGEIKTTRISK